MWKRVGGGERGSVTVIIIIRFASFQSGAFAFSAAISLSSPSFFFLTSALTKSRGFAGVDPLAPSVAVRVCPQSRS
jgi:hypothetical protein